MTHNIEFPVLGLKFNVNPTAFSIGDYNITWYGIIIAVGFLLAIGYGFKSCKKMNINKDGLFDAVLAGLIFGIIGARLYYVIFYPGDKYIQNPIEIFYIHEGGLGIYGGIIGGLLAGAIVAKIRKLKVGAVLDVAALGYLIGQGIGRWGNFINQEAFGGATDLPWGMASDTTRLQVVGNVHPCFLYESLLCLLGFVVLHFFTRRLRRYDGQTFLLYIIWYGASRFVIEGLRTDSLLIPGLDIRVSQAIAAGTVVIALVLLIVFARKTSLSGCGSRKIMELNAIVLGKDGSEPKEETIPDESTIFKGRKYTETSEEETTEDGEAAESEPLNGAAEAEALEDIKAKDIKAEEAPKPRPEAVVAFELKPSEPTLDNIDIEDINVNFEGTDDTVTVKENENKNEDAPDEINIEDINIEPEYEEETVSNSEAERPGDDGVNKESIDKEINIEDIAVDMDEEETHGGIN